MREWDTSVVVRVCTHAFINVPYIIRLYLCLMLSQILMNVQVGHVTLMQPATIQLAATPVSVPMGTLGMDLLAPVC